MNREVIKNKYGFYELKVKPESEEFLRQYYQEKYYQENKGAYESSYSDEEIKFIKNKIIQKHHVINDIKPDYTGKRLLDIGCGEGWVLKYFHDEGWDVSGLDYSRFGIENNNPLLLDKVTTGNIYDNLTKLTSQYDIIWLENVLEHVMDPHLLLTQITKILSANGILMIEVPNDFSILQEKLIESGHIDSQFWVTYPDHISYFNKEGLTALCQSVGLTNKANMASFPIDFNLFNADTNYVKDKSKGKNVHLARVELENLLTGISISDTVALYKSMSGLGLGREIISFFTL